MRPPITKAKTHSRSSLLLGMLCFTSSVYCFLSMAFLTSKLLHTRLSDCFFFLRYGDLFLLYDAVYRRYIRQRQIMTFLQNTNSSSIFLLPEEPAAFRIESLTLLFLFVFLLCPSRQKYHAGLFCLQAVVNLFKTLKYYSIEPLPNKISVGKYMIGIFS